MKPTTITSRIEENAFDLLEQHPEGMRWSELDSKISATNPSFHPKTINGTLWKLPQKYPDKVIKQEKGIFCLTKYCNNK